jgi:hypothetical protein
MPSNRIIDPFINPLQFLKEEPDTDDRFRSRDFTDFRFKDTIRSYEQPVCWLQPWQASDLIHLQLRSTYAPITVYMHDAKTGYIIDSFSMEQIRPNFNEPDFFIYELEIDLSGYAEDYEYIYFTRTFGNPVALTQKTGPIHLTEEHENTLLIEFKHYEFREDWIFETGTRPNMRIPGILKYKSTGSKNTLFEDNNLNTELIRSINYRIWTLFLGGTRGVPPYFVDKVERMLGCSELIIDGKYFTKIDGNMEAIELENYPMSGYSIDLRERVNRASRVYDNETAQNATVSAIINTDSKGFGADNSGNETVIVDVQ